jgi:hypothetical protein
MHRKALKIFYGLSIFVWMTVFFAVHQTNVPEVNAWQSQVRQAVTIAWEQTYGDRPVTADFALAYEGVTGFYERASGEIVGLMQPLRSDRDLYHVFAEVYGIFARAAGGPIEPTILAMDASERIPENFMREESVYNIVPVSFQSKDIPEVSGVTQTINSRETAWKNSEQEGELPVNNETKQWVTLQDNITGAKYCLAIYNGEVNKYLGPCAYDYR